MSHRWWAVGCLVLWQTVATAQAPRPAQNPPTGQPTQPAQLGTPQPGAQPTQPPLPVLDPQNNRLDYYLLQWEKEMMGVESLVAPKLTRTEIDLVYQRSDVFEGNAKYLKPNYAMLEMKLAGKSDTFEKFICSGQTLFQYVPSKKEIQAHTLPQKPGGGPAAEDNFLTFLFGMKAAESKRRYNLTLANEDKHYVYIDIEPRSELDKADFQKARLVLNKSNFMPRQLWFEQPNKDTVTWDIPTVETKVALKKEEFTMPTPPPGWQMKQMPRLDLQSQPRVIRLEKP
jgi:TIGR03009 family protein